MVTQVKNYIIQRKLGAGGMGVTFLASREGMEGFKKQFAIKRLHPYFSTDDVLTKALIDEARIACLFNHPNVVSVFEFEQDGGDYFIVMEYVDGVAFSALLKVRMLLPPEIVFSIILQVLRGLDHMHNIKDASGTKMHLTHRDISPDNILLSREGIAKLSDFGLVKSRNQQSQTAPGVLKGKLSYMSPEQSSGVPVDHRSDLYSIGIVLYEGLTGVRLFKEDSMMKTLQRVQNASVPPLRRLLPGVDPKLEQIVSKALSRLPEDRFQSAQEFHDELEQFVMPQSTEALRRFTSEYIHEHIRQHGSSPQPLQDKTNPMMPSQIIWDESKSNESQALENSKRLINIHRRSYPTIHVMLLENDPILTPDFCRTLSEQAANSRFCELHFLQKDEEYELVENELKTNQSSPAIVIFGGLHVALQHGYLRSLRFHSSVAKVLVMDHVSAEVMEMAINLCGLSIFIEAPFTPTQLLTVLKKFLSESSKHMTERMQHLERELESSKERERDLHTQLTKALQQHPPHKHNNRPPPHRTHNGL